MSQHEFVVQGLMRMWPGQSKATIEAGLAKLASYQRREIGRAIETRGLVRAIISEVTSPFGEG